MKRMIWRGVVLLAFVTGIIGAARVVAQSPAAPGRQTPGRQIPTFQADPSWPKIPNNWVLGLVSGVTVDSQDHIWVLHRPSTVTPEQKDRVAPPVLEFDAAGNFIQAWGGPGQGYEWFGLEHGISVDHRNFVWLGGSGEKDDQLLKFTRDGKFVMQIGRSGQSKGNADTKNVHQAADVYVYPKTNEVFVADGYGNRRVIVFDANTGAFKRMWGAFGNAPTDPERPSGTATTPATAPSPQEEEGPGSQQFNLVHGLRISKDGLVYVCDRDNKRVQVFTVDGKFIAQVFISRRTAPPSTLPGMALGKPIKELADGLANAGQTASRTGFSTDPEQRLLYVIDRSRQQVAVLDRKTLEILGYFGDGPGSAPGSFYTLHDIAVDSKGNVYTAEVHNSGNRRAQKLTYKGMSSAPGK